MNYAKTALLLAALTAIFVAMGAAVGGQGGLIVAFIAALIMNMLALWKSDSVVLRMFKAREVTAESEPEYYELVRALAERAELPMPRVYVIDNPQPNAFATGRNPANAAVAASTGLLQLLSKEEVAGVIAHELAHIKNRDTLTMAVAATIGGAISMLAQYLQFGMLFGGRRDSQGGLGWIGAIVAMLVAPFAAMLVQMAISRSREYQADRLGAMIAGNPYWLASALQKINAAVRRIPNPAAERVPAAAHVFIINPLTGQGVDNWFSTHPNTDNRIAALKELADQLGIRGDGTFADGAALPGSSAGGGPWSEQAAPRRPRSPWG
ncbi:MAG: zinc metalloprotease HtpX [Hyphomicrobium sp.]